MKRILALFLVVVALSSPAQAKLKIQQITSPGGIKAWLVEEHSIPFTSLEIRFDGGTALDDPGKRGSVYMMAGLLEEGAGELDATAFRNRRDALAASFSFDAGADSVAISAKFLTENRDQALDLLGMAINKPRFDQTAIDRVRAQILSIIAADRKNPRKIASDAFYRMAFGTHPYGSSGTGTEKSVTALTRDDIVKAWKDSMSLDHVYVAAVGDITPEELGKALDKLLGGLPKKGKALPGPAKVALTGGVSVIKFPAPQSVAVFGHAGISRDDPDFFAAFVMNRIFGSGDFTSRLTREVREKRGLTYGVYTWLAHYRHADLMMGSVSSANESIAKALEVIRDEWKKMATGKVTSKELDAAKRYLTGAYPLRFDGNARIASILVGMQLDGMPVSYIDTRNDRINAVTLQDVERVAKRLMKPDDLRILVVGQPVGLKATD